MRRTQSISQTIRHRRRSALARDVDEAARFDASTFFYTPLFDRAVFFAGSCAGDSFMCSSIVARVTSRAENEQAAPEISATRETGETARTRVSLT